MFLIMLGESNHPHQGRRVTQYAVQLDAVDRSHDGIRWGLSKVGKDTLMSHCRLVTDCNGYEAVSTAVWVDEDGDTADVEVAFYYGLPKPGRPLLPQEDS